MIQIYIPDEAHRPSDDFSHLSCWNAFLFCFSNTNFYFELQQTVQFQMKLSFIDGEELHPRRWRHLQTNAISLIFESMFDNYSRNHRTVFSRFCTQEKKEKAAICRDDRS